jgi:hypothetical protein
LLFVVGVATDEHVGAVSEVHDPVRPRPRRPAPGLTCALQAIEELVIGVKPEIGLELEGQLGGRVVTVLRRS